jgi:nicotinate-nucleotide pyrophosphorylase (carboxylating)
MTRTAVSLAPEVYRDFVSRALAEDIGAGDVTTNSLAEAAQRCRAVLLAKAPCVIAGLDVALEAFRQLDPGIQVTVHRTDGDCCEPSAMIAELEGRAAAILTAERTALNILQRLSGIATLTRQFVDAAAGRITVLDTRKTTPLLRAFEKYAVRVGGGTNHRSGLDDGVLIKDNHLRVAGGVADAVSQLRQAGLGLPVEVEAETLDEVDEALEARADIVLLDNFSTADIIEAVKRCRGRARTEISGGVTLSRIEELAATGADFVSVGALTHSAPAVDLSLELEPLQVHP